VLGRGLQQRTCELCLCPLDKTAMAKTLVGVLFVGMAHVSQSILEILKTITIVIVFKISKMDCDTDT
jgi:hypothetical protein